MKVGRFDIRKAAGTTNYNVIHSVTRSIYGTERTQEAAIERAGRLEAAEAAIDRKHAAQYRAAVRRADRDAEQAKLQQQSEQLRRF